jgi:serine/threonine protein kinase
MQPPITIGTVLQNRYRIVQILGQGGFGRTYLAEDQRRFNELCAIKELILTATGVYSGEKAQELFEREAAILYQIEHPQIPKFRERFEQDQRLFLVQEYVAGKTYRSLLAERQPLGQAFSEVEVLQLLRSLLPVLEHIHSRGIIHRDISPENMILRASDGQPVLIDFGVVKEIATRLQSPDQTTPVTSVGKLGYAPTEQMQTGRAYPSSDLYALAVTTIVLLTGKEPSDLFDETRLTWNWQQRVSVNPRFAQVIQRMLNYMPGERYQSAADVIQALQSLDQPVPTPDVSYVQTIAVGHRPDPITPNVPNKPTPVIPPSQNNSILDNPLVIGAIGSVVVILAGVGSWSLVTAIRSQSKPQPEVTQSPQNFPTPLIFGSATPTPTPTPTSTPTTTPTPTPINVAPVVFNRRLNLGASNTAKVDDSLKQNQIIQYTFRGKTGQKLNVFLDQANGIALNILDSNGQPVANESNLLVDGRYTIKLSLDPGVASSDYSLNVTLEDPIKPTPTPTETPTSTPIPTPTVPTTPSPTPTTSEPESTPTPEITPTPVSGKQNSR